jgi:cyclohexanecarboxylate-CoA ligase
MLSKTAFFPDAAARYRAQGDWRGEPLAVAFGRTCADRGDADALIDGEVRVAFAAWARQVEVAAAGLLALGVRAGDVVAYQLPNWWEAAVVFMAAARIGAVANPVLPIFRERELRFILAQSGAQVLFIPGVYRGCDHPALIAPLRADLPALTEVIVVRTAAPSGMHGWDDLVAAGRSPALPRAMPVDPDAVAMLMYTSGTTAEPKGVLHTHETLTAEVRSLQRIHGLRAGDRTLMPSPLTHISGVIHAILTPALIGTSAVLMDRWDAVRGLDLIDRERVTYMVGAPPFLHDLIDASAGARRDVSSLRLFSCGGAAVSAELIRRARATLGCVAKRVYGSTEFPTIATTDAADAERQGIETEGRPIAPNEVRIVADDGTPLGCDCQGEIQARGPECCVGYADAALNGDAFTADGWFRTGDLGIIDAAGYLRVTGRVKDIVIRKGEKISVRELELLIGRHPAVAETAVVALPDPRTGECACAVVVVRGDLALTLAELTAFLRAHGLATHKLPERLEIVAELPRTESGKVHRAALRDRFSEG